MSDIEQRLHLLKNEVDALQIAVSERTRPWYANVPTIISIAALLFSFGTTAVSYKRSVSQDVAGARAELRQVLQRMVELPKELTINNKTYADNPSLVSALGQFANQENGFLVAQANGIVERIPKGLLSAGEYYSIAYAYQGAYEMNKAREYYTLARESAIRSRDFNNEVSALRSAAALEFAAGKASAGRDYFQEALEIFSRYPEYDQFTKASTNALTLINWAGNEMQFGERREAEHRLAAAEESLESFPGSPLLTFFQGQIALIQEQMRRSKPRLPENQ